MVINKLQIELDKIKRNALTMAIIMAVMMTLGFSIFSSDLSLAQVIPTLIEIPFVLLLTPLIANRVLENSELNTPHNLATLKGTSFGIKRLVLLMGALALSMLVSMLMHHKLNSGEILGFAIPFLMNLGLIFVTCANTSHVNDTTEPLSNDPHQTLPWPKSIDFNDEMRKASNWSSDPGHPLSFTNPSSPNFPGASTRWGTHDSSRW